MNIILLGIFIILLIACLTKWYINSSDVISRMPSFIPRRFIFGNYFDVDLKRPHISLEHLGRDHKDVFSMAIFGKKMVVLNSYQAIASLHNQRGVESAGRPNSLFIRVATSNMTDLVFSEPTLRWARIRTTFHKFFAQMKRLPTSHSNFTEVAFFDEWPSKTDVFF